jgi:hypothetical protein
MQKGKNVSCSKGVFHFLNQSELDVSNWANWAEEIYQQINFTELF